MTAETTGATSHFTEAERNMLKAEDIASGKTIVLLLTGIFLLGLGLYIFVAWWVS